MKEKFGLSAPHANLAAEVLAGLFPDSLGVHPDELFTAACALRAAAIVCDLAAVLHEKEGREVLLRTACQKLYLSPAKQDAVGTDGTQELVVKMFGPVYVDLIDPINSRRDAWEPKLIASRETDVAAAAAAALNRLNSLDPAWNIDNTDQPECCTGCVNSYTDCVHSSEEDGGECVGREIVSVSAEQHEDLPALDGEPGRDGDTPAICGNCERD